MSSGFLRYCVTLVISVAGLAFSSQVYASALEIDKVVTFELPRAPLTPLQRKKLPATAQNLSQGSFVGRFRVPEESFEGAALVVIHSCHKPEYYDPWLARLNAWGYATLSFSRCQPPSFIPDDSDVPSLDWRRGSLASIGALNFLAAQARVDEKRIGVLSWSRLGMIPLSILNYEGFAQFFENKFALGVALYPFCSFARGPHGGPLLIVAGAEDQWIDNTVCTRLAAETKDDEFPAKVILLAGATHGFDIPEFGAPRAVSAEEINPDRFAAGPGVMGFHQEASNRAIEEVRAFLKKL